MSTYSEEHKRYLSKLKKNKIKVTIYRLLIIVTIITIWQVLANKNIINTFWECCDNLIFYTFVDFRIFFFVRFIQVISRNFHSICKFFDESKWRKAFFCFNLSDIWCFCIAKFCKLFLCKISFPSKSFLIAYKDVL